MFDLLLAYLISLGPYAIAALGLGVGSALLLPWLLKHPGKWLLFAIFLFSTSLVGGGASGADGSLFKQLAWGGIFLVAGLHVFYQAGGAVSWPRGEVPPALWFLVGFVLISPLWAETPEVSLRRAVQVFGVLLVAIVVARGVLNGKSLCQQLIWPLVLFMLLNLAFAAISPGMAFDQDHALRGVFSHKNTLGQFCLLAILVFLSAFRERLMPRAVAVCMLTLCAVVLYLSRSTTSLLVFLMAAGLFSLFWVFKSGGVVSRLVVLVLVLGLLVATLGFTVYTGDLPMSAIIDKVFSATGKSQTLTGRSYLWELVLSEIGRHPWLGIGYGSFWMGVDGPSSALVRQLNWGPPSQAHNGYLDVINEVGLFGMGLLAFVLLGHFRRIVLLHARNVYGPALFHGVLLFAILILNYTESSLLRMTHIWWIALCCSIIEVQLLVRQNSTATPLQQLDRPGSLAQTQVV